MRERERRGREGESERWKEVDDTLPFYDVVKPFSSNLYVYYEVSQSKSSLENHPSY